MKRNLLLLIASSFLLAGCNPSITFEGKMTFSKDEPTVIEGKMNVEPKAAQGPQNADVITYLVLTKVGKYSGSQQVKAKDDNLFLENFIEFKGKPGDALPGADQITATSGAKFLSWVAYENTGALTYFDKVPSVANQIYYAYFESNANIPGPSDPGDDPVAEGKYAIYSVKDSKTLVVLNKRDDKDLQGRDQYEGQISAKAGDVIQLYDLENKAGWIPPIEGWSFGGKSDSDTAYTAYLTPGKDSWTVVQDFTASIFAKFAYQNDSIYFGLK